MKLTRVTSDDWEGLYLDDELVAQNHSVDVFYALQRAMNKQGALTIHQMETLCADEDWIGELGRLPIHLSEVKV